MCQSLGYTYRVFVLSLLSAHRWLLSIHWRLGNKSWKRSDTSTAGTNANTRNDFIKVSSFCQLCNPNIYTFRQKWKNCPFTLALGQFISMLLLLLSSSSAGTVVWLSFSCLLSFPKTTSYMACVLHLLLQTKRPCRSCFVWRGFCLAGSFVITY